MKQELREGGRDDCSPAKNLKVWSSVYGNFSTFLVFSGNSCSFLAPIGKCWQLKGVVPPGPHRASISGVSNISLTTGFSSICPISASSPTIWLECPERMSPRSPRKFGVSAQGSWGPCNSPEILGHLWVCGSWKLSPLNSVLSPLSGIVRKRVAVFWHVAHHS